MNKANKIKNELKKVGREIYLQDGAWYSTPFFAVISPRWRYSKSDFESEKTQIGVVSTDYYSYIGPFDHNIEKLSEDCFVVADGVRYAFKKRESVKCGAGVQFYCGILKRVWEDENDLSKQNN